MNISKRTPKEKAIEKLWEIMFLAREKLEPEQASAIREMCKEVMRYLDHVPNAEV